jgi:MFS family permease
MSRSACSARWRSSLVVSRSPLESGLVFSVGGAGYFVASKAVTGLVARTGRQALAVGALAVALGYAALMVTAQAIGTTGSVGWLLPGLAISGFGLGTVMAPMSTTVLTGVAPQQAASAAGVLTTAQQVGTALGVAIIGIAFCGRIGPRLDSCPPAFRPGLLLLIVFRLVVACLVLLLPRPKAAERPSTMD